MCSSVSIDSSRTTAEPPRGPQCRHRSHSDDVTVNDVVGWVLALAEEIFSTVDEQLQFACDFVVGRGVQSRLSGCCPRHGQRVDRV